MKAPIKNSDTATSETPIERFPKPSEINYRLNPSHKPVNMGIFEENRGKLIERFTADHPEIRDGVIFLEGGRSEPIHATDNEHDFRQESFFHWAFGVKEPDCFGWIDIKTRRSGLFMPLLPKEYEVWMGKIKSEADFRRDYGTDEVQMYTEKADDVCFTHFFEKYKENTIYLLSGTNTDSYKTHQPASHPFFETWHAKTAEKFDKLKLWDSFVECRVTKSESELALLRHAVSLTADAHKEVMRQVESGWGEYEVEALFRYHVYRFGGCRHLAYTSVCASGPNSSVLHYGHAGEPHRRIMRDGDMVLFDMGADYHGYCADITCSYPLNGTFTEDQKIVYQAVYNAFSAVKKNLRVGVLWTDMHLLAEREILVHLKEHELVVGDLEDMMANRLGALFMPHGLGHMIGHDVHEVGGYATGTPRRSELPGLSSLRTARRMEEGMTITIEPGCYFIWSVIEKAMQNERLTKFLDISNLNRFKDFGGVRIETNVIVHKDCCEDMCDVPRTIAEIEDFFAKER